MSKELIDKVSIHDEENIKGFFNKYRPLSNFHICDVWYEGLLYTSTESAYQAAKLLPEERWEFTTMTPSQAMKAGRVRHLESDKEDWMKRRVDVMNAVLFEKFKDLELRKLLLETGDKYLEETNWWNDTFWGASPEGGQNTLGKLLMNLRNHYRVIEKLK
jgi:ribA/ribD-fused uncharacterized protein